MLPLVPYWYSDSEVTFNLVGVDFVGCAVVLVDEVAEFVWVFVLFDEEKTFRTALKIPPCRTGGALCGVCVVDEVVALVDDPVVVLMGGGMVVPRQSMVTIVGEVRRKRKFTNFLNKPGSSVATRVVDVAPSSCAQTKITSSSACTAGAATTLMRNRGTSMYGRYRDIP